MKRASLTIALIFIMASWVHAQEVLKIEGPKDPVGYGEIAEVSTNVEITEDEQGLPSHTIEWSVPRNLRNKVRLYENGSLLAIPTGCSNVEIVVEVRVTDWINRRIAKQEFVVIVGKPGEPKPVDPPTDPPIDPIPDYSSSDLYRIVQKAYKDVQDPKKDSRKAELISGLKLVTGRISSYQSIESLMEDLGKVLRGEVEGLTPWDWESRRKWDQFRTDIGTHIYKLEKDGKIKGVLDMKPQFETIVQALKEIDG